MPLSSLDAFRLRWARWRNGILSDPGFRRWASGMPVFRQVSRRYARDLFDLSAGFIYAQITQALVESGLVTALKGRSLTLAEAADVARLSPEAAETLLKAGLPLALTERIGAHWTLGTRGAALSTSSGLAEMIAHHHLLYADLADPLAMLRGEGEGRLARLWSYDAGSDPADVAAYSALMAASQPMVAEQALAAYRFDRHKALLDIAGGEGAFVSAVARTAPGLRLGLFDLPPVVERARARFADSGLQVALHPGSFRTDALPGGYDLITLVRVLHDHDDAPVSELLAAVRQALAPGGRALIVEPLAETPSAPRVGHAYFGFYLAAMRSGRPRSCAEYRAMARAAGFSAARLLPTPVPLVASVVALEQ